MTPLVAVDAPSVWLPRDFSDESEWSFDLNDQDQRALIDYGRGSHNADVRGQLGEAALRWASLLNDGPGFVRLRNFPVDCLTEQQIAHAYIALGSLLGNPVGQDREGNLIAHIRDERTSAGQGRKYQTNLSQGFHCDASDLVGLLCLKPAKSGGLSKIVSSHTVYNEMLDAAPHLVEALYHPLPWSRHARHHGEAPYVELAPITDFGGKPRIFFIPWYIRHSQQHEAAPRLTKDQLEALDLMERTANDPAHQIEMRFRPGDIQLLNNGSILHSREAYIDHDDLDLRRLLLRLWLSTDDQAADQLIPNSSIKR